MVRKTDRRSLRTQSAIKKAFEELLAEKNISEISITELAERADIHRATFSFISIQPALYHSCHRIFLCKLLSIFTDLLFHFF